MFSGSSAGFVVFTPVLTFVKHHYLVVQAKRYIFAAYSLYITLINGFMRKFYSFIVALLAVCGMAQAQVTFDFSGEEAYKLFGLTGFSSSDSHDGDITENVSLTSGDVTIVVSPSEKTNANRMWSGSLRLYGGTLAIASTGKNITAIQFELNSGKWGADNTATPGTLETGKWTGDAVALVITIAANTQIKSMTVYMGGEEPGPGPDPQPSDIDWTSSAEAPLSVAAVLEKAAKLEQGANSDKDVFVKGKISQIKCTFSAQYGTAQFSISDDGQTENEFLCYGTYYLGNRAWVEGDTQIEVGDDVIVCGTVTNYKGTLEMANKKNYIYSLNGKTDGGDTPEPQVKTYTKIADVKAAATTDKVDMLLKANDLLVTYVNGPSCYVFDGTDGLLLYGKVEGVKAGDKIAANVKGQLYLYNGLTEIAVSEVTDLTVASSDNAVTAQVVTIADITNNYKQYENELVVIKELMPETEGWNNRNINFMDDSDNVIVVRDNFKTVADVTFDTAESYDITGFVSIYNGTVQLFPRDAADLGGETPEPYEVEGAGTLENPYTVADLVNAGLDQSLQGWMHGYIVGFVDGQSYTNGAVFPLYDTQASASMEETDNQLILTITVDLGGVTATEKWTATFANDLLTSFVVESEYPTEEMAQEAYQEALAEQQEAPEENPGTYTLDGKVLRWDDSAEVAGTPKEFMKAYFQSIVEELGGGSEPVEPSNTNILIADDPYESDPAQCVPVQLANKLGMREALSLKDAPDNIGKEIWLHGDCLKYFSVPGVKNIDDWSFDGKTLATIVKNLNRMNSIAKDIYNLNGQRMNSTAKAGIYVVGGRKVVVK